MTSEQLIEKFNPANGANVSPEDLEILHNLTDAEIDILADAYPNTPTRRSYLRLYDKTLPENKQLYQLSTWQNLRNVRKFSNKKNLIAWDFYSTATKFQAAQRPAQSVKPGASSPKKVVVDLTAQEAAAELTKNLAKPAEKTDPKKPLTKKQQAELDKKNGGLKVAPLDESQPDNESLPDDQDFGNGGAE